MQNKPYCESIMIPFSEQSNIPAAIFATITSLFIYHFNLNSVVQ